MREIKFRAWDEIEKKIWEPIVGKNGVLMAQNQIGGFVSFPPYQDPLMQYTGLKDKNSKEIYESDVVLDCLGVGVIEYSDKYAAFRLNYINNSCAKWFYDYLGLEAATIEVIGNIYENPELLEREL